LFNKNNFINWNNNAINSNPEMRDYRNSIKNPMKQEIASPNYSKMTSKELYEDVENDENAVNEIAGTMVAGGVIGGVGAGVKKLTKWQSKKDKKRKSLSGSAYGYSPNKHFNFGDERRAEKEQQHEGVLGTALKVGAIGAVGYGAYKSGKKLKNSWKNKQAAVDANQAQTTPSTPMRDTISHGIKTLGDKMSKSKAIQDVRGDVSQAATAAGSALKKGAGNVALRAGVGLGKSGKAGWAAKGLKLAGRALRK